MDAVFEALAHPMRRRIVDVLKREGELPAGDLSSRFELPKPTMSHHLGVLLAAGLIDRERRGRNLYYRINLIDLRIPPVRERREDVLGLACGYLAERAEEQDGQPRQLSTGAGLAPIHRGALAGLCPPRMQKPGESGAPLVLAVN